MPINPQRPLLEVVFDPATDCLTGMGIVVDPAIQKGFQMFAANPKQDSDVYCANGIFAYKPKIEFKQSPADKRILVGEAMSANKIIYRREPDGTEYDVLFTEKAIRDFVSDFNSKPELARKLNFNHTDYSVTGLITNNVIATPNGFAEAFGVDFTPGGWLIAAYIEDERFWNEFVASKIAKGFSIEINYTLRPVGNTPETIAAPAGYSNQTYDGDYLRRRKVAAVMGLTEDLEDALARNRYNKLVNSMRANKSKLNQLLKNYYEKLTNKETGFDYYVKNGSYIEREYLKLKTA